MPPFGILGKDFSFESSGFCKASAGAERMTKVPCFKTEDDVRLVSTVAESCLVRLQQIKLYRSACKWDHTYRYTPPERLVQDHL